MKKKIFGKANMNIAGTTFNGRQGKIWALRKAKSAFLTVRRDPNNEFDKNAVKVLAHITTVNNAKSVFEIGYIPKEKAEWVAKAMDDGKIVRISKYEVVGGGKASLGVKITIAHELFETEVTAPAVAPAE